MFLDFILESNSTFIQAIPSDWNAFVYTLKGEGIFGDSGDEVKGLSHHTLILS